MTLKLLKTYEKRFGHSKIKCFMRTYFFFVLGKVILPIQLPFYIRYYEQQLIFDAGEKCISCVLTLIFLLYAIRKPTIVKLSFSYIRCFLKFGKNLTFFNFFDKQKLKRLYKAEKMLVQGYFPKMYLKIPPFLFFNKDGQKDRVPGRKNVTFCQI